MSANHSNNFYNLELVDTLAHYKKEFTALVGDLEFVNHIVRTKKQNLSEEFESKSSEHDLKLNMGINLPEELEEVREMSSRLLSVTRKATAISALITTLNHHIADIDKATDAIEDVLVSVLCGVNKANSLGKVDLWFINKFNTTEKREELESLLSSTEPYLSILNLRDM